MNIVSTLHNLCNGKYKCRWKSKFSVSSTLLEEFQCHMSDEHPIIDDEEGITIPPLACAFCPVSGYCHILALADENGCLIIYNTRKTGIQAAIAEWLSHTNAVFDLTWMKTERKLITASGDQTAVLWDALTGDKLEVFKGHTSSIKSVCMGHDSDAVFATGSRDGHIMVWDTRCNKKDKRIPPVNIIRNAHSIPPPSASKSKKKTKLGPVLDSQQSVTNVLFQDQFHLVSAGAVDGVIKVWDLRKNYCTVAHDPAPKYSLPYCGKSSRKHGFSSLVFDSSNSRLFASCTDDVIYQYDFANYSPTPVHCYKGHQNSTFYVKAMVSPDDQFLASGSSDHSAYIWKIGQPQESPVTLQGHTAEVTTVAWAPQDFTMMATLSDDNTMRVWRATKRMSISSAGSIIGNAERVRREIGVSTASLDQAKSPPPQRPCEPEQILTPPPRTRPPVTSSGPASSLSCRKNIVEPTPTPPSIKRWLMMPRDSKPVSNLAENCTVHENAENIPVPVSLLKSLPTLSGSARTPVCKRKLINCSESERQNVERPRKRKLINCGESELPTVKSPRKRKLMSCESDLDSHGEGPQKRACRTPLDDVTLTLNTPDVDECALPRSTANDSCYRDVSCGIDSPIRKIATGESTLISSPTANLPNLVFGIGVVTPPRSINKDSCTHRGRKCRTNWLTKLTMQRHCDSENCPPLITSPKSSSVSSLGSELSNMSEINSVNSSPIPLHSPVPGVKSILSYFRPK